jgi:hypothetical protein
LKYRLLSVLLVFVFVINGVEVASAQTTRRLSATPKAFQVFYGKFRKAAVARQKITVASLTRFPFKYAFDAGDEGTYSRTQFLKNFNHIFGDGQDDQFFRRTNPTFYVGEGKFELIDESDATHYIFQKKGASYQFTAYLAEP